LTRDLVPEKRVLLGGGPGVRRDDGDAVAVVVVELQSLSSRA
jgi:hypothetical protein